MQALLDLLTAVGGSVSEAAKVLGYVGRKDYTLLDLCLLFLVNLLNTKQLHCYLFCGFQIKYRGIVTLDPFRRFSSDDS